MISSTWALFALGGDDLVCFVLQIPPSCPSDLPGVIREHKP